MKHFRIVLALINNPKRTKLQTEYANDAVEASAKAQKHNPGYICKSADIIEEDEFYTFEITLVKLDNPEHKKVIQVKSINSIRASKYAEKHNPGFVAKSSDLI